MADPSTLDEQFTETRQATDRWQQEQLRTVATGGEGTLASPKTELQLEGTDGTGGAAPRGPTSSLRGPQAGADETLAPQTDLGTGALGEAVKALGGKGKELAAALHPGVKAAARGIGMDEDQAEVMATGLVEFLGGLPGPDEGDTGAGIETGLAALPAVGMALKGAKAAGKLGKAGLGATKPGLGGIHEPVRAVLETEKGLRFVLEREFQGKYVIKTEDGQRMGAISYGPTPDGEFKVSGVEVSKEFQRQGVASTVYDFLEQRVIGKPFAAVGGQSEAGAAFRASRTRTGQKPSPTWQEAIHLDEADRAMEETFKTFQERLSTQRRAVRTDLQVGEEAARLSQERLSWESILSLPPGTIANDAELVTIKGVFKEEAEGTRKLAKWLLEHPDDPGRAAGHAALLRQLRVIGDGLTKVAGVYAEPARTVRLLNKDLPITSEVVPPTKERVRIADPYLNQWLAFFQQQAERAQMGLPSVSPDRLAAMIATLKTPEQVAMLAKVAAKPSLWDLFVEYWINGLLSGPQTHATNLLSNAATLAWAIPERAVGSLLSRSVRPNEATALLSGIVEAQGDAWRLAWLAFKTETAQMGQGKLEGPLRAITADALELTGTAGRAVDFLGSAIRLPGRTLIAADEYFKAIAFRGELRALAKRESFRQVQEAGLTGKAAANKMAAVERQILSDPPASIQQAAREFASYVTFTRDLGPTGQKVQAALSTPLGRIVVPFVRTPTNIFKYAGERTPFALASKSVRDEIAAGGDRRALALAKISLGSMTMAYLGSLAAQGFITGGGPKDKGLRQELMLTGWQPYSFKVGDTYYKYSRIEPLGSLIGLAADAADLLGQLPQAEADELAAALVVALSRNVSQKTFVAGLAGTLNAVASQDIKVVQAFFEKELPTLLPYSTGMGQTARAVDPVLRSVNSILDAFKAKVPGYSDTLPPRRNLWGEPILLQGGVGPDMISPIYTSTVKDDPVAAELVRLGLGLEMPTKTINGVPLTPDEYDAYVVLQGAKPIIGDQTLRQRLTGLMASGLYQRATDGPDGGKATLIRRWVADYRDMARFILSNRERSQALVGKDFPDLQEQIDLRRKTESQKFSGGQPSLSISP